MKTYIETINHVAKQMFDIYLGSGEVGARNADIIAYIFDERVRKVYDNINEEYIVLRNHYYNKLNK